MDAGLYFFINQGCLTVDNMDDPAEMVTVEESKQSDARWFRATFITANSCKFINEQRLRL